MTRIVVSALQCGIVIVHPDTPSLPSTITDAYNVCVLTTHMHSSNSGEPAPTRLEAYKSIKSSPVSNNFDAVPLIFTRIRIPIRRSPRCCQHGAHLGVVSYSLFFASLTNTAQMRRVSTLASGRPRFRPQPAPLRRWALGGGWLKFTTIWLCFKWTTGAAMYNP